VSNAAKTTNQVHVLAGYSSFNLARIDVLWCILAGYNAVESWAKGGGDAKGADQRSRIGDTRLGQGAEVRRTRVHREPLGKRSPGEGYWLQQSLSPRWRAWSGNAFEGVCLKHIPQLRRPSELSNRPSASRFTPTDKATQDPINAHSCFVIFLSLGISSFVIVLSSFVLQSLSPHHARASCNHESHE
jgi:hypothetical protein